jgi:hypothetical protein
VKSQAALYLGVLERVHHQFARFRVPVEGVTKFLDLGETTLCFNIKDAETAPWLRFVCNSVREMAIEAFSDQKCFNASGLDLLELFLLN